MQTAQGTSVKWILEEQTIRKVWFDPRNDVDALYHQFGILPKGIFDLQIAEVASISFDLTWVVGARQLLAACRGAAALR